MFIRISNTPRDYAWGSSTAIAGVLGRAASGRPEAELWLGSHPGSPSVILDPDLVGGATTLAELTELPFLLKVLAADAPLSLQAHPTPAQAAEGFAREDATGIPLDAPHRNYRDASGKPEIIVALEDGFEALCGFRDVAHAREIFELIAHGGEGPAFEPLRRRLTGPDPIRSTFDWLVAHEHGELAVLDNLCTAAAQAEGTDHDRPEFGVVRQLAHHYPGDPGIAVSVLLNHVTLATGEALFLPAGNIHAYLRGVGIELMTSSDNVLRGGLTAKHVDVAELLRVLDFSAGPAPRLAPDPLGDGTVVYRPEATAIALLRSTGGSSTVHLPGPAIALCTGDLLELAATDSSIRLARGEAVLVTPGGTIDVSGTGFLAAESID